MNRRALLVGGASIALGTFGVYTWQRESVPRRDRRVRNMLLEQFPNPVSLSPDGTKILVKSFLPTTFELAVLDRKTKGIIASDRAPDTQLAPTWSPDGTTIAYFADHDGSGRYDLFTLDVATSQRRRIDAPQTMNTALRWSPRGRRLAYFQGESGRRELVVNTPDRNVVVVDDVAPKSGFDWSPDGSRLATVHRSDEGVVVVARATGGIERRLTVVPGGTVHAITWSPTDESLLVTCAASGSDWFGVAHVDLATSTVKMIATPAADLSGPLFTARGFLFHENVDGDILVRTCDHEGGKVRTLGPSEGHSVVTGFSPDGSARILHTSRDAPPALDEIALEGDANTLVWAGRSEPRAKILVERWEVRAPDGVVSPTYAWRSPEPRRRALIRIHGGPNGQSMKSWQAPTDLLARAGFDVVSVNYRGSSGYGLAFEHAGTAAQRVADVLAACDHARSLGAERVYLWGHSYGAELALAAALSEPTRIAGVALLSLTGPPAAARAVNVPALAFHGESDGALSAKDARTIVSSCFGKSASFTAFPNEGHSFTRIETWTQVYTAVLGWLDHS